MGRRRPKNGLIRSRPLNYESRVLNDATKINHNIRKRRTQEQRKG
jgi:hypothetical protein